MAARMAAIKVATNWTAARNEPLRVQCVSSSRSEEMRQLEWPKWSSFTLLAIVLTSLVTLAATINDIW
jgi:hypothetical protein